MSEQHPNQPPSGYPYPGQPGWNQQPPAATGMTKAAMIVGIIAVVLSFIPFVGFVSFILGSIAVVLGIVGLVKKRPRKGFALTGLITGAVALIVCVVYVFVFIAIAGVVKEGAGKTAPYTYTVTGESAFTVKYLTEDVDQLKTEEIKGGTFTKDVRASTLLGFVTATNAKGNTGELTCKVTDDQDNVVSTNTSSGSAAEVTCPVVEGITK